MEMERVLCRPDQVDSCKISNNAAHGHHVQRSYCVHIILFGLHFGSALENKPKEVNG